MTQTDAPNAAELARAFYAEVLGTDEGQTATTIQKALKKIEPSDHDAGTMPTDIESTLGGLAAMIITEYNGGTELPQQQVEVEYLKRDQMMKIPFGLQVNVTAADDTMSVQAQTIKSRYWQVVQMGYLPLRALVAAKTAVPQLRAAIFGTAQYADQRTLHEFVPLLEDGTRETREMAMTVYATVSMALCLNYDIRDTGALLREDMRVSDVDWKTASTVTKDRLSNKLCAYTLKQVSAMNLKACGNYALAALMRSTALGFGVLPAVDSAVTKEYYYTHLPATPEETKIITMTEVAHAGKIPSICMNLISVFGLLHLAKDHTYRSQNDNMTRITNAWLNTVRTITNDDLQTQILQHSEVIARTAPHPFGLAQTYWVALAMFHQNRLAAPLRLRVDATPPPVQRVFIAKAARDSWSTLPLGAHINAMMDNEISVVMATTARILESPPSFSGLHRLYGLPQMMSIGADIKAAVDAIMPVAYGYTQAAFVEEGKQKTGLALALSFENVKRDMRAQTHMWEQLWSNYFNEMTQGGLNKYVEATFNVWKATGRAEASSSKAPS